MYSVGLMSDSSMQPALQIWGLLSAVILAVGGLIHAVKTLAEDSEFFSTFFKKPDYSRYARIVGTSR